ncbi:MAG: acyl carrier protein [Gemmataceae bacterium]
MTSAQIQAELAELLANFQGREYSDPIERETRFFADLGFASIDAVVLGETLEKRFGRKLPFSELLAGLAAEQAEDLEVGVLVDFLAQHLGDQAGR